MFWSFFWISTSGFGGALPWAERILVEERRWLTSAAFADLLALCQFVPGPNIVNVAVVIGARSCGIPGAVAGVAGLILPAFVLVVAAGALYDAFGGSPIVRSALNGLAAAAAGVLIALVPRLA